MTGNFIQLVVNPIAGSGKAKKAVPFILKKFQELNDTEIRIAYTTGADDAIFIAREAILNGASMVVSVGGDGTVNEVINGFFINKIPINPLCELGVIDCGTGGGYASTINLPESIEQQIELILHSPGVSIDLGCVDFRNSANEPVSRFFVGECQTGIGSLVVEEIGSKLKAVAGRYAFFLVSTVAAVSLKPSKLRLKYDNDPEEVHRLLGLVVGNGIVCGGGMKLTPNAKLNDGLFDVLLINQMSIIQRLMNLSKVYSGKHILSRHFSIRRCKKIKVESDLPVSLEADGELLGYSPFTMEIFPQVIKVKAGHIPS
ncbi:MAG: diacylglycerol kinase family protein [Mariniphaga sp.]